MTNLPIAVSTPAPAASRRAQANALQQNAGLAGAAPADETSFHDALVQMLGKGLGKAFAATGDAAVKGAIADSSRKTGAPGDAAPDASALPLAQALASALPPDASALPLPQALAAPLATAAPAAGLAPDASDLPLPQALTSALIPESSRHASVGTMVPGSKAALAQEAGAETPPAFDASALSAGLTPPQLTAPPAPTIAVSVVHSEALKDVLATPVFDTASSQAAPPTAFSMATQATEIGNSTPTHGVPEPSAAVQTRVGERGWDQAVGEKLVWMVDQKHQVAQLHLNPPDLGPLKISISLDQNQASAQFFSAHASVREALEVAMPRLREMLADSGITLGNASVGAEAFREPTQQPPRAHVTQPGVFAADSGTISSGERLLRPMLGLVDTFA